MTSLTLQPQPSIGAVHFDLTPGGARASYVYESTDFKDCLHLPLPSLIHRARRHLVDGRYPEKYWLACLRKSFSEDWFTAQFQIAAPLWMAGWLDGWLLVASGALADFVEKSRNIRLEEGRGCPLFNDGSGASRLWPVRTTVRQIVSNRLRVASRWVSYRRFPSN